MNSRTALSSAMAIALLVATVSAAADPPRAPKGHRGHHYHHHPLPPPPPRYRYDGAWVAPAIIGGIGLGYLLSQPNTRTVVVEQPAYQPRCDETTTYDRFGNRTTTRTCY
jgi:hypothetical protein